MFLFLFFYCWKLLYIVSVVSVIEKKFRIFRLIEVVQVVSVLPKNVVLGCSIWFPLLWVVLDCFRSLWNLLRC